jgi:3-keto-disaccharide hydrolase
MTKHLVAIVSALILLAGACSGARAAVRNQPGGENPSDQPLVWNFDSEPTDGIFVTGAVFSGTWEVRAEADAPSPPNALCQTGTATFPALSLGDAVFGDIVLTARFKPISGREDQAAGLLFRIQDQDNYYILRANALEGNVNFYKYASGRRSTLKEGKAQVPAGHWQELRVEAVGNVLRGFLDGQPVVELTDDTYQAGQVGLWTKADSLTCFDDVEARAP